MKYSQIKALTNNLFTSTLLVLVFAATAAMQVSAQIVKDSTELAEDGVLEQCQNGTDGAGQCTGNNWVQGQISSTNSSWNEGDYIPYRLRFSGLATGTGTTHTVDIEYNISGGGDRLFDYLGTFDATATNANPCSGVSGCTLSSPTTSSAIPADTATVTNKINPNTNTNIAQPSGVFTLWGGTITSVQYRPYTAGSTQRVIRIKFTAARSNPVLSWSGHVAWAGDWGNGNTGGGGSSYYTMQFYSGDDCNFKGEVSACSIRKAGAVIIVKQVINFDGSSPQVFNFTASSSFNPLAFGLVDDNAGPGVDYKVSRPIIGAKTLTVTEGDTTGTGYTLLGVTCVESIHNNSTLNLATQTETIIVDPGEIVKCTFSNGLAGPTASPVSIGGRVVDWLGNGIGGVNILVTRASDGTNYIGRTNPFGFYSVDDLPVGDFYIVTVSHKRYTFTDNTRTFTLDDNLTNLDFTANP